jgi:hypothetical protein
MVMSGQEKAIYQVILPPYRIKALDSHIMLSERYNGREGLLTVVIRHHGEVSH